MAATPFSLTPSGGTAPAARRSQVRPVRPLRVAVVAPPWFEVPPRAYGGIESLCFWLADGLARRGHEVTLVAAGDSRSPGRLVRTYEEPPSARLGESLPEVLHAALAERALARLDVDVVHDNSLAGPLAAAGRRAPTVVTAHGPVTGEMGRLYEALGEASHMVAISEAQRRTAPQVAWRATIPNGIPVESYPFRKDKDDFALFLGRMSPDKAPHLAIEACRAAGVELVVAAKCNEPAERAYFEAEVRPRLGRGVEYVGEVGGDLKHHLLSRARCLVFPIQWEEPFGIVMVEALACGTPVVALGRGSVPEIVVDGVCGFVRSSPEELPEAILRSSEIAPADCRARALEFDVSRMVLRYEALYAELAGLARAPSAASLHARRAPEPDAPVRPPSAAGA